MRKRPPGTNRYVSANYVEAQISLETVELKTRYRNKDRASLSDLCGKLVLRDFMDYCCEGSTSEEHMFLETVISYFKGE